MSLSATPQERTAAFVEAALAKHGPDFVRAWLSGRTCRFSAIAIFTTVIGSDRLRMTCEKLLAQHDVEVRIDATVSDGFHRDQDMRMIEGGGAKKPLPSRAREERA